MSGVLCAALLVGVAAEARAELNLNSSVKAQCIGGMYSLTTCEVLRFTLDIPDPQIPANTTPPAVPGTSYSGFGVSQFTLESLNAFWRFDSLKDASPGDWSTVITSDSEFQIYRSEANSTGTAGFPLAPIYFDVLMSIAQSELVNVAIEYTAGGLAMGPNGMGVNTRHAFSAGGLVSTVPEPMSMLLLGSGLAGIAGARRRRNRSAELLA
jgi:hypothetical protein